MRMPRKMVRAILQEQILPRKSIKLIIVRQGKVPPIKDAELIGKREIRLLLGLPVIGGQETLVVVLIVGKIIGVLR